MNVPFSQLSAAAVELRSDPAVIAQGEQNRHERDHDEHKPIDPSGKPEWKKALPEGATRFVELLGVVAE